MDRLRKSDRSWSCMVHLEALDKALGTYAGLNYEQRKRMTGRIAALKHVDEVHDGHGVYAVLSLDTCDALVASRRVAQVAGRIERIMRRYAKHVQKAGA